MQDVIDKHVGVLITVILSPWPAYCHEIQTYACNTHGSMTADRDTEFFRLQVLESMTNVVDSHQYWSVKPEEHRTALSHNRNRFTLLLVFSEKPSS